LSVITVVEVEIGVARIERRDEQQGVELRRWLDRDLPPAFEGRLLPIDVAVARRAAGLYVPAPRSERDVLIAATALEQGMTVVTLNIPDFASLGPNSSTLIGLTRRGRRRMAARASTSTCAGFRPATACARSGRRSTSRCA
jgi:predicted nucleic acid-binding protein